jgi:hypothetical protein
MNQVPIANETPPRSGVRFDKTIKLSDLLTFIGFMIAGFAAWASIDKRLTVGEEYRVFQRQVDMTQDQRSLEAFVTMKETLSKVDRQVERIVDRLDKVPNQVTK